MKILFAFVFNTLFIIKCFALGIEGDSTQVVSNLSKIDSLMSICNQNNCPKDIVDQLCQIYKNGISLSKMSLPFESFSCMPIKSNNSVSIKLHPNLYYDDNMVFSMKSKDGNCLAFLDFTRLFVPKIMGTPKQNEKERILQDIAINNTGQPRWSALKTADIDLEKSYQKQAKCYTSTHQIAKNCNADSVYVCSLSNRANIGFYTNIDPASRTFNTMDEFKTVYSIILTARDKFPIYLFLFCKTDNETDLNKYLSEISKSLYF